MSDETDLDKAIAATIGIALIDGHNKHERLVKGIERMLLAARAERDYHWRGVVEETRRLATAANVRLRSEKTARETAEAESITSLSQLEICQASNVRLLDRWRALEPLVTATHAYVGAGNVACLVDPPCGSCLSCALVDAAKAAS